MFLLDPPVIIRLAISNYLLQTVSWYTLYEVQRDSCRNQSFTSRIFDHNVLVDAVVIEINDNFIHAEYSDRDYVFRNYTSATFLVVSDRGRGVLKASWTGPSSFLSGLDRRNCLSRKGLLSDLANGRSADGRDVLRRAWTRQRHSPLQMSART